MDPQSDDNGRSPSAGNPKSGPTHSKRLRALWGWRLVIAVLVIAHFSFLMAHFAPAISTPDSDGYFLQSTLIAREGKTSFEAESPLQYINPHWVSADNKTYYSQYSPGFPAIMAVFQKLFGPAGALLVNPVLCSLTILGLFLVCRLWVGPWWGLVAAAVMAINPTANQQALWSNSHTSVAFFLVFGLFFLIKWSKTLAIRWAIPAGLFLAMMPVIRAPAGVMGLGVVIFMLSHWVHKRAYYVSAGGGAAAASLPLLILAIHNQLAFGAFWRSGYSLTHEATGFGWHYFLAKASPYLQRMISDGMGYFVALGLVGMLVMCCRRDHWRKGALLLGMALPIMILYMAYYWQNVSMRFLVPASFLLAIASVWTLNELTQKKRSQVVVVGVAIFLVSLGWGMPTSLKTLNQIKTANSSVAAAARFIEETIPEGSLIAASDPTLLMHLNFINKWDLIDLGVVGGGGKKRRPMMPGRDMGPRAARVPRLEALTERYAGRNHGRFMEDLTHWREAGQKVFIIQVKNTPDRSGNPLAGAQEVASREMPAAAQPAGASTIRHGNWPPRPPMKRSRRPKGGKSSHSLAGKEVVILEWGSGA